ncbi:O-antigen ligase family protein [Glutamicibacter arilaitensis]
MGFAESIVTPLRYLFIFACAVVIIWNAGGIFKKDARPLLPVAAGLLIFFALRYFQAGQVLASLLILAAFAAAIWSIGLYLEDLSVLGVIGVLIAALSLAMAIFTPLAWQENVEKSLIDTNAVLAGPFPQMNVLGMTLVVLFPFTGLFRRRSMTILGGLLMLVCVILSSSRSSVIAFLFGLICAVLTLVFKAKSVRAAMFTTMSVLTLMVTIWLPFATTDPKIFTNRGAIWMGAVRYFEDSWLLGRYDVFGFRGRLVNEIGSLVSHGHNLAIHYLAMSGIVGFFAILIIIAPAIASAGKSLSLSAVPVIAVITLLSLGVSELPLRTDSFDGPAWATWGTLLCLAFIVPKFEPPSPTIEPRVAVLDQKREAKFAA